jgi:hypothetical protein
MKWSLARHSRGGGDMSRPGSGSPVRQRLLVEACGQQCEGGAEGVEQVHVGVVDPVAVGCRCGPETSVGDDLGARAVMIGRAYLWGLAANGQAVVENVLDILRAGIDSALLGLGKASVRDLGPEDVLIQPGFSRGLGALNAHLSRA